MTKFQAGDVVGYKRFEDQQPSVVRRIVYVGDTGYVWEYPEFPGERYHTEYSSDPWLLAKQWVVVDTTLRGEGEK